MIIFAAGLAFRLRDKTREAKQAQSDAPDYGFSRRVKNQSAASRKRTGKIKRRKWFDISAE